MDRFFNLLFRGTGMVAAILLILTGLVVFGYGGYKVIYSIQAVLLDSRTEEKLISGALKHVDIIFIGLVIKILGLGIYELFVSPLERLPAWLVFKDFDQLKVLLVKACITVVAVSFTSRAVTWDGQQEIVYYGIGIAAAVVGLTYFIHVKSGK